MGSSNFPSGLGNVTLRGMPLLSAYPGKVFWVDSNNPGGQCTFDRPGGTIAIAQAKARASKGDLIVCKAGHAETVTAAAGIALTKAGVAVVGLGVGANRPTINFTTATTADLDIDAANCTIMNFLFTGGIDALAGPIDVNAADFSLLNCEYRDVTGQATDVIIADAASDRLLIDGYFHNGAAAAGGAAAIALIGMDNPIIRNFRIIGNFSAAAIECRTTAVVDLEIYSGYIWTKNAADLCIKDTVTGSTGRVGPDLNFMLTDNAANITEAITGATFQQFDPIYVNNLAGEKAILINTTAATDA